MRIDHSRYVSPKATSDLLQANRATRETAEPYRPMVYNYLRPHLLFPYNLPLLAGHKTGVPGGGDPGCRATPGKKTDFLMI
jgi:hypothetical protein